MFKRSVRILILLVLIQASYAQDDAALDLGADLENLELTEPNDIKLLQNKDAEILEDGSVVTPSEKTSTSLNEIPESNLTEGVSLDLSGKEEVDDLESLKDDVGSISFDPPKEKAEEKPDLEEILKDEKKSPEQKVVKEEIKIDEKSPAIFDVGKEEEELLKVSKFVQNKIPENEWNDIAAKAQKEKYTVVEGDWLWKIAKTFFGSGFFYAKIWSLNPYITNPHEIEPGMVLTFDTGSQDALPTIQMGSFAENVVEEKNTPIKVDVYGSEAKPDWLDEKKRLLEQGVFVQYASDATYEDLEKSAKQTTNNEYEKYDPPTAKIVITDPNAKKYDDAGFDKDSQITFKYKEGFYLTTFLSTNIVQDFGQITHGQKAGIIFSTGDTVYVKFDKSVNVVPGEMYSIYEGMGKVKHESSERTGYKYAISGHIRVIRKIDDKWECEIEDSVNVIQRNDRITVHTPKIPRIIKTFNPRVIEAALIGSYAKEQSIYSIGSVVYLDRGRADGLEMGNVLEVYNFIDNLNRKRITKNPTYKVGELTVITLTDNFATALVTSSKSDLRLGDVAVTKSPEDAARTTKLKNKSLREDATDLKNKAIDELDVELNLNDLNEDLLEKADKVELTEDELEELERQEREKSILKESEKDLKALERLEKEIESAESQLNEAKLDEDKLLETQNLEVIEKNSKAKDGVESLNEIEQEFGKKYLDEDLNNKDNPYGLTEFDLEEVDELLNTDKKNQSTKQKSTETLE